MLTKTLLGNIKDLLIANATDLNVDPSHIQFSQIDDRPTFSTFLCIAFDFVNGNSENNELYEGTIYVYCGTKGDNEVDALFNATNLAAKVQATIESKYPFLIKNPTLSVFDLYDKTAVVIWSFTRSVFLSDLLGEE